MSALLPYIHWLIPLEEDQRSQATNACGRQQADHAHGPAESDRSSCRRFAPCRLRSPAVLQVHLNDCRELSQHRSCSSTSRCIIPRRWPRLHPGLDCATAVVHLDSWVAWGLDRRSIGISLVLLQGAIWPGSLARHMGHLKWESSSRGCRLIMVHIGHACCELTTPASSSPRETGASPEWKDERLLVTATITKWIRLAVCVRASAWRAYLGLIIDLVEALDQDAPSMDQTSRG